MSEFCESQVANGANLRFAALMVRRRVTIFRHKITGDSHAVVFTLHPHGGFNHSQPWPWGFKIHQ
jgi:hypothetical protein